MKKVAAIVLAIALLTQCIVVGAVGNMSNFKKSREYVKGTFTDVKEVEWFYTEIANAYRYGIANGKGQNTFVPIGMVTIAEAITFASRVNNIYSGDEKVLTSTDGQPWYMGSVNYAQDVGIIKKGEFEGQYDRNATRAEVAYIFSNALPLSEFAVLNGGIYRLPDVSFEDNYYQEILMLYRCGIVKGSTKSGKFLPNTDITRAEATAILNRVIDKSQRKTFTLTGELSPMSKEQILKCLSPSIFKIETKSKSGSVIKSSNGFFIGNDGVAVVGYNFIKGAYGADVFTNNNEQFAVEKVLGYSQQNDIAIIKVKGNNFDYLTIGQTSQIKTNQDIFYISCYDGVQDSISFGNVLGENIISESKEYLQISAAALSDSDFGIVVNGDGKVIGINTFSIEKEQIVKSAMPSSVINDVARDYDVEFERFYNDTKIKVEPYYIENQTVPDFGYHNRIDPSFKTINANENTSTYTYEGVDLSVIKFYETVLKNYSFAFMGKVEVDNTTTWTYMTASGGPTATTIKITLRPKENSTTDNFIDISFTTK